MFVMMNAARLQVGVQGVGHRRARLPAGAGLRPGAPAGPRRLDRRGRRAIFDHPDVRRTLVLMKAKIEAARAICLSAGVPPTSAAWPDDGERAAAKAREELLTPIAKAWSTDLGVEVASLGVQVHGGMGFIEETGAAQHYRDARIAPIYEGTNGIQAIDLVGRKLRHGRRRGRPRAGARCALTAETLTATAELAGVGARLRAGVAALERATDVAARRRGTPDALAGATPYLKLFGDVVGGWLLGRQALRRRGRRRRLAAAARARWRGSTPARCWSLAPARLPAITDGAERLAGLTPELMGAA